MVIKYFKDLPKEEQLRVVDEVLNEGEFLYGLSPEDDTHVKFAVMMAMNQLRQFQEEDLNVTFPVVIGVDEKGLWVSYALNKVIGEVH